MLAHVGLYLVALEVGGSCSGYKDHIVWGGHGYPHVRERRADDPAAAVASDCLTDLFRGGYSDSKVIVFIFQSVGDQPRGDARAPAAIDPLEIPVAGNCRKLHLTTVTVNDMSQSIAIKRKTTAESGLNLSRKAAFCP